MSNRPRAILVIGWIFITVGCITLVAGLRPLVDADASQRIAERPVEYGLMLVTRIVAVLGGAFMLYGFNWARWLIVVWMGYHLILSLLHSPFELLIHTQIFGAVLYFLFRPQAAAYFRGTRAESPPMPESSGTDRR
ncbi:MAG: hypothetical protein EXS05_22515 [Planctomycetaceae bacterium]|nr:hypothetical protein [Planctomycetaceae bacterium]